MSYTEQEFNEAMARLDGKEFIIEDGYYFLMLGEHARTTWRLPDYHNDLNLLMPLAWNNNIEVRQAESTDWLASQTVGIDFSIHEEPIQAIRDCLWQLTKEGE